MTDQPTPPDSATAPDQWEAIASFLAGEGSAGDSAALRQWLIEHPDDAHVVTSLEKLLPTTSPEPQGEITAAAGTLAFGRPIDVEGALRRVHAKMETAPGRATLTGAQSTRPNRVRPAPEPRRQRSWTTSLLGAAAVLIGAVGLIQGRSRPEPLAPTAAVTYNTPVGTSDSVLLPDGSQVILAAGSRLVVSANYGQGQRDVELRGAGRFTVKHDAANPFSVRAGSAIVRDLGTVFTVKSDGAAVVVAVTEGSVSLSDSAASRRVAAVDLNAGDRGRLLADGSVVAERGKVTPDDAAWVVGKLAYRDAQ
ncbi:MAG: FecR domain-containing protein, partial [Phycisphaerae bacterium]|nr:FecR domain-containing protein [Gemmatimonadaceae bacterium]